MVIAERIRRQRLARGLTVRELGRRIGVSGSAISQWEAGGAIKTINQISLSAELDIPIIEFLPPEAMNRDLVVADPEEKLLIQRFRALPGPLREAYLRMLIVQGEHPAE
jgi:transcriptional regulator with XRE-family HTH domain